MEDFKKKPQKDLIKKWLWEKQKQTFLSFCWFKYIFHLWALGLYVVLHKQTEPSQKKKK